MALRAVDDHPKLHDLKNFLNCGRGEAMGYLEALWHFTGRFTPAGNIGAYSDTAIESWIEWKGDSGALVKAMVDAKWIDRNATHRLIVHDWHEHADDATKLAIKRKKLQFVTCINLSRQVPDNIPMVSGLPEPEPEPELLTLSAEQISAPPAAYLPLVDGSEFPISQEVFNSWVIAFPGVDIPQHIARMRVWLDANATRRVTRRGALKFANRWLSKEQDSGAHRRGGSTDGAFNRSQQRTNGNIEAATAATAGILGKVVDWPSRGKTSSGEPADAGALFGETIESS